nr:hypothetical protein CTI12_AA091940 [Tanacetum cinerariifolium]
IDVNKVKGPSTSNSFDALKNMDIGDEYGTSSSRSTHEEDSESELKSAQWNEDLVSDDEVDEYIFPEGDKTKPIISLLEETRLYTMQRLVHMKTIAMNLEDKITPSIIKRLEALKEEQRLWELYGIPCVHSVAGYLFLNKEPNEGVDHWTSMKHEYMKQLLVEEEENRVLKEKTRQEEFDEEAMRLKLEEEARYKKEYQVRLREDEEFKYNQ